LKRGWRGSWIKLSDRLKEEIDLPITKTGDGCKCFINAPASK